MSAIDSILSAIKSEAGVRIVNVTTGKDAFLSLDTTDVNIDASAILHTHKTAKARLIVDHRTVMPVAVRLSCFFDSLADFNRITNLMQATDALYMLVINGTLWSPMTGSTIEVNQDAETLSLIPTVLEFKQILPRQNTSTVTTQGADAMTARQGLKSLAGTSMTQDQLFEWMQRRI